MNISRMRSSLIFVLATLMVALPVQPLSAQPGAATTRVSLSYSVGESLTISATPSTYAISSSVGSNLISVTTAWNFSGVGEHTLELDAWLGSASAALSGSGGNIASASIFATEATNLQGGTPGPSACTSTAGSSPAGAACPPIFVEPFTASGFVLNGSNTSTIGLALPNSSGLAAGSYTGTLTLYAQVY